MPESFSSKLYTFLLPKLEIAAIVMAGVGYALRYAGQSSGNTLLMIGLSVLAGVFFLTAFKPLPNLVSEDPVASQPEPPKPKGLADLLITIAWKALYISAAVAVDGFLFWTLQLPGFGQMLLIGTFASGGALILAGFSIAMKNQNLEILRTSLIKVITLFLVNAYLLYNNWPLPPVPQS